MLKRAMAMLAASGAIASPAWAQDAPIQPSGKWVVAFEDTMCVLSRDFGAGESALTWSLRPMPGDPRLEMTLARPAGGKQRYRWGAALVTLEPMSEGVLGDFDEGVVPKAALLVSRIHVDRAAMAPLGEAASLSIRLKSDRRIRIALPGIGNALKTLAQCEDDLMRRWGFDPEVQRTLTRPARRMSNLGNALTQRDYPLVTLQAGLQGTVRIRWTAGADGRARNCIVVVSSGVPVLDEVSCVLIVSRMHYRPALGRDGKPVDALDSNTFSWIVAE